MRLHIDVPARSEIEQLLAVQGPPCVSLYIATSPLPADAQAARIELKNLAAEALSQLERVEVDRGVLPELREAFEDLGEDDGFWAEQAWSLAVFASPGSMRTFRLPNRLTSHVEVGDRYYVKPLLRTVTFPQAGFVLALAAGSVRLVEVLPDGPAFTVDVPDLPARLPDLPDRAPSARLQGDEGQKVRLRQYARQVDQALRGVLGELPLILAATEPLASIYRSVNRYPRLADTGVSGNPEAASDDELAAAARTVFDELYARELAALGERFQQRLAHDRASSDVATVARAATYGAVDTLLVDIDAKLSGRVDEDTGAVTFAEDDASSYGVVDEIARRALLSGGRVVAARAADVPGGGPLAALLRHAL